MKPRILIQGIGSIGGVMSGELVRAGYDPVLVSNNATITAAVQQNGLQVLTSDGDFTVQPRIYTTVDEIPADERFDIIFLVMMAHHVEDALRASIGRLRDTGYVVSFQNGIVEDEISALVGAERVVSASVVFGATMEAPGVYRRTTKGMLSIGEMDGQITDRITDLQQILQHILKTDVTQNISGVLWAKLAWNCAVNALASVSGLQLGALFADKQNRDLFFAVYREVGLLAQALNITMESARLDPADLFLAADADAETRRIMDEKLERRMGFIGDVTPSMLQNLQRGRKTEINALNGYVMRQATRINGAVPLNEMLWKMVSEIERGEREITPENLELLR